MSVRSGKLANINVIKLIDDTLETIVLNEGEFTHASDDHEQLERVKSVLPIIKERIESTDDELLPLTALSNINQQLTNLRNSVKNYCNNHNIQELNKEDSYADAALKELATIPFFPAEQEAIRIRTSLRSARRAATEAIKFYEEKCKELEEKQAQMAATQKNIEDTFGALEKNIDRLNGVIENQKQRLDNSITQYQDKFLNGESSRNDQVNRFIQGCRDNFDTAVKDLEYTAEVKLTQLDKNFESKQMDLTNKVQSTISVIQSLKEHAEKLVGIIGTTGMEEHFIVHYNKDASGKIPWHFVGIG